jgi:hypothetical protein
VFRADTEEDLHTCRDMARVAALKQVVASRQDSEGLAQVDVEAVSAKPFKSFRASVQDGSQNWRALRAWRGGAVSMPTRNHRHSSTGCWWCGEARASARHMWTECPHFCEEREALQKEFDIPASWWKAQPRCTSKSGWITFKAAKSVEERSRRMVAACRLGMQIVLACWRQNDGSKWSSLRAKRKGVFATSAGKRMRLKEQSETFGGSLAPAAPLQTETFGGSRAPAAPARTATLGGSLAPVAPVQVSSRPVATRTAKDRSSACPDERATP